MDQTVFPKPSPRRVIGWSIFAVLCFALGCDLASDPSSSEARIWLGRVNVSMWVLIFCIEWCRFLDECHDYRLIQRLRETPHA